MKAALLTVVTGEANTPNKYLITGQRFIIGTSPDCDLVINREAHPTVSRKHAAIEIIQDNIAIRAYISDSNSMNGTYVNHSRIERDHELKEGDVVSLSKQEVELTLTIRNYYEKSDVSTQGELSNHTMKNPASRSSENSEQHAGSGSESVDPPTTESSYSGDHVLTSESDSAETESTSRISATETIFEPIGLERVAETPRIERESLQDKMHANSDISFQSNQTRPDVISIDTHKRVLFMEGLVGIKSLAIDGKYERIAYCTLGGELCVRGFSSNKKIGTYKTAIRNPSTLQFSKDGQFIAIGRQDISIWDANLRNKHQTLVGHKLLVSDLAFSADSKTLVSCSLDKTIRLWDVQSAQEKMCIPVNGLGVANVDICIEGSAVLSAGKDRSIALWNSETGKLKMKIEKLSSRIDAIYFLDHGDCVIFATSDRVLHKQSIASLGSDISSLRYSEQKVMLAICSSGHYVGCLDSAGRLEIWEISL